MAVSTIGMLGFSSVFATAVLLFGLGVGWNVSFVAATAQLVDLTEVSERGRLIGFNDRLSAFLGAAWRCWAATRWTRSASRRWPSARR